jgi:hypothetical protein
MVEMVLALTIVCIFFVLLATLLSPSPYSVPAPTIVVYPPTESPVRVLLGLLFLIVAALLLFLPERI